MNSPCPACGVDVNAWGQGRSYTLRLLHALDHPISEVRMAAVISLGNRRVVAASLPLARCALKHPTDFNLAMEIINALKKLPKVPERDQAVSMLKYHSGRAVRKAAKEI
jgi:hypothetical protein